MNIIDSITNLNELATLPTIVTRIMRMLDSEDVNVRELSGIIEHDPSLTLKILRVVNSPVYATRQEIVNVSDAIMLIGFRKLTNLILGVSVFSMFWLSKRQGAAEVINKFWYHSSSTATIAKAITKKMRRNFNENEFVGGLLHQIGKMAMIQYDFTNYKKVIDIIVHNGIPNFEAEHHVFGTTHFDVGHRLAEKWQLPEVYQDIILNYLHPSKTSTNRELVASVSFADLLSEIHGADFYQGGMLEELTDTEPWKILSAASKELNDTGAEAIEDDIDVQLKASIEFLNSLKL